MKLDELLHIMENRVLTLTEARRLAVNSGDITNVEKIDGDLSTTLTTINQLKITIQASSEAI
jgi:hypothetical protein